MDIREDKLLTLDEVADFLGVHRRKVGNLINEGKLRAIVLGDAPNAHRRVRWSSLKDFIQRQETGG